MTTCFSAYTLTGREVPIYRYMLENWFAAAKENLDDRQKRVPPAHAAMAASAAKRDLDLIAGLIQRTYNAVGDDALEVNESLRLEAIFQFWEIMDAALAEAELNSLKEQNDGRRRLELELLENVVKKVKQTQISSTFGSHNERAP